MPLVSLLQPATLEQLRHRFGDRIDRLTPSEVQALAIAKEEGVVSNRRLQDVSRDHPVDIGRMLQGLVEAAFLASDSRRRWTTYRLIGDEAGAGVQQASLFEFGSRAVTDVAQSADSEHKPADSEHKPADSEHRPAGSEHTGRDSEHDVDALPPEVAAAAARVADRTRAPVEIVRQTILTLCHGRFLSAEDLGRLLRRHPSGLRQRFLTPMVAEGLLVLRYPGAANRPDQAYTAADPKGEES